MKGVKSYVLKKIYSNMQKFRNYAHRFTRYTHLRIFQIWRLVGWAVPFWNHLMVDINRSLWDKSNYALFFELSQSVYEINLFLPILLRKQILPRYWSKAGFLKMCLSCEGIDLAQRIKYDSTCLHKNHQNQISIFYCKSLPTQGGVEHEKTICQSVI